MQTVVLSILFALCAGCGSGTGGGGETEAKILVTPSTLTTPGDGGSVTLTVTANAEWGVFGSGQWITCSPTGGLAGTTQVTVTVEANPSHTTPRTAEVTVKSGTTRRSTPLTQGAATPPDLSGMFVPEGYGLLWNDEFDGTALKAANWTTETGGHGWGNNELQYYTARPENVKVADGKLVITARKEDYEGAKVTSARLITMNKFYFKYGYVVASIKLPKTANGLWPAFWMMGNDFGSVGWPKCGETDILEMGHQDGIRNGTSDRFLNGACHWGSSYAYNVTHDYSLQDGQFHTYTCVWDEKKISMYIDCEKYPDARPYFEMTVQDNIAGTNAFRKDNFLLLNLAVGGNFPGIFDISKVTALSSGSAEMQVDYVRVFQKP